MYKSSLIQEKKILAVALGCALFRTSHIMSYLTLFTHSNDKPIISLRYWLESISYISKRIKEIESERAIVASRDIIHSVLGRPQ